MHLTGLPAIDTAEEALTGQDSGQMLLEKRPGPICQTRQAVACPRLRPLGSHLPGSGINVDVHQRENGAYLEAAAQVTPKGPSGRARVLALLGHATTQRAAERGGRGRQGQMTKRRSGVSWGIQAYPAP